MAFSLSSLFLLGAFAPHAIGAPSPSSPPANNQPVPVPVDLVSSPSAGSQLSAKPVSLDLFRKSVDVPSNRILRRRDDDIDVSVYNFSAVSYNVAIDIGSPAQQVRVIIDTGSSELWVNPNCAKAQSAPQQMQCLESGHYNESESSTSKTSSLQSQIQYGIGAVAIRYVSDTIALPGSDISVENVIFGKATDSHDMNQGILGLSFGKGYNLGYATFVDELVLQNVSNVRGFGMALGSKDEEHGGVLTFGGVDTKKFSGRLHTEPIIVPTNNQDLYRYWVRLGSVGVTTGKNSRTFSNSSAVVFFDSGATLSYLPTSVVKAMASALDATYDNVWGLYRTSCSGNTTIDFTFGDFVINVPLSEFVWDMGIGSCFLGVEASDDIYLLGDSFLRSVYAVYDMDTPAIHFAQYVNCGSNAHLIPAGANRTADFEGECSHQNTKRNTRNSNLASENSQISEGSGKNTDSSADRPIQSALMAAVVAVGVVSILL